MKVQRRVGGRGLRPRSHILQKAICTGGRGPSPFERASGGGAGKGVGYTTCGLLQWRYGLPATEAFNGEAVADGPSSVLEVGDSVSVLPRLDC